MIAFSTMSPTANNSERRKLGREEHATPSWNRLTSGDRQAGKMRGENSTKEARKEMRDDSDRDLRDTWDSGDLRGGFDSLVDRSSSLQRLFTLV